MTQSNEKHWAATERERIAAGFHVPFFAPGRGKSFEGRVFTPHFAAPEGRDINTTKRRSGSTVEFAASR